jgi:hypothetical protein
MLKVDIYDTFTTSNHPLNQRQNQIIFKKKAKPNELELDEVKKWILEQALFFKWILSVYYSC